MNISPYFSAPLRQRIYEGMTMRKLPTKTQIFISVLPISAVDTFQEPKQLKIFPPKKPVMQTLYMVTKRNRALTARFRVVKSIFQKKLDAVKMC